MKVPPLRRALTPSILIPLAVAGAFLAFLVLRFDVDLGATWLYLRGSHPGLYLLGFLSYYASFLLRGWRWRVMAGWAGVGREEGSRLPSVGETSLLILLGWFVNSIGWLRAGDAYRAYAFARSARSPFPTALGTVVAERVVDVGAVLLLLLLVAGLVALGGLSFSPLVLLTALVMVALGALFLLLLARMGRSLPSFLPARLRSASLRFQQGALGGVNPRGLPFLLALGVGGWLLEVGRLAAVVKALGFSLPFPLLVLAAMTNALLTTFPFTPGGLGLVEPGLVGVLLLGLGRDQAVATALLDRSISYLSIIALGALAFTLWELGPLGRRRL